MVQGTPGGGVGGFGTGAPGAGAGGTSGGAGGAGAGAAGIVQSTLGIGAPVQSYDPAITGNMGIEHLTQPLSNIQIYGVPSLQQNTGVFNLAYQQAFPTGTSVTFESNNNRQTTNSVFSSLVPTLGAYYRVTVQQQLLSGFGLGPNLRFLRIAKNNKKISDIAFKDQLVATITQISNIYWDLVSAYEQERVTEQSFSLRAAEPVERAEAIAARGGSGDGCDARRSRGIAPRPGPADCQDQPAIAGIADEERDHQEPRRSGSGSNAGHSDGQLRRDRCTGRPAGTGSDQRGTDGTVPSWQSRTSTWSTARSAARPRRTRCCRTLSAVGFYGGTGLAGELNPNYQGGPNSSMLPTNFWGAFDNAYNNTSPDYFVGLNLNIPIRNRVAKADQYRSELEYRQAELRQQQLKKQIRIEVRNAQYALEQSRARVQAAKKARDLADRTFTITKKEQDLGAGSSFQTLTAQRDLAVAELDLVNGQHRLPEVESGVTARHRHHLGG